jgi:O-methyltransferase involved in polyketide biosynthesis
MADLDISKPNAARIYDYWLGGKDNFAVDRAAGEAVRQQQPDITDLVLENKQFLTRAVSYVAAHGVRQFVDVGSGLPTSPVRAEGMPPLWLPTHEAAQAVVPGAFVAYVDNDPVAVVHSQVLLAHGSSQVVATQADMLDPDAVLANESLAQAGLDLTSPVGIILGCVLHFLDYETARTIAAAFIGSLVPGSYVIMSVGRGDGEVGEDFESTYNAQRGGGQVYNFSRDQVAELFTGLDLVPPGIVPAPTWRPEQPETQPVKRAAMILAGVGRRP